jgi:hypothetical protein
MLSAPPLILLLAVAAAAVAPSAARIVKFAEGSTSIEAVGRVEHVVVRDTGTFDEYLALFTKLRDAVSRADRSAVVKLVNYPLRVNGKKPLVLQNAASLTKSYEKVFTVTVQEKIRKANPQRCSVGTGGRCLAMASSGRPRRELLFSIHEAG